MTATVSVVERAETPGAALNRLLESSARVRIATAFLKNSGWGLVKNSVTNLLGRQGSIEILVGLDFRLTEPSALMAVMTIASANPGLGLFAFSDPSSDDVPAFHPKLYIGTSPTGDGRAIVGSSNLTRGGLETNQEANLLVEGPVDAPPLRDLVWLYERFRKNETIFVPDRDYLETYAEVFDRVRRRGREALREAQTVSRLRALKIREEHLPGTVPTQRGLVVQAIRTLAGGSGWAHWKDIARWVEIRARELGLDYQWDTLGNSVRGRLNRDTLGKDGDGLFERLGGVTGRQGKYRLTEAGLQYRGRPLRNA